MATEPTHSAGLPTVRGLYELGHVLHVLDAGVDGFARGDIERVECFWDFGDMHHSEAGFVFVLRDGRRVYVDFRHWHAFEQDEDFSIDIEFLSEGQAYPAFSSPHEPVGGWSSATAHLDKVIAR